MLLERNAVLISSHFGFSSCLIHSTNPFNRLITVLLMPTQKIFFFFVTLAAMLNLPARKHHFAHSIDNLLASHIFQPDGLSFPLLFVSSGEIQQQIGSSKSRTRLCCHARINRGIQYSMEVSPSCTPW